jgi:CrcB protein
VLRPFFEDVASPDEVGSWRMGTVDSLVVCAPPHPRDPGSAPSGPPNPAMIVRASCQEGVGLLAFVSVFVGAGLGAVLRWWLGARLNPLFPTLPLGTLAANLLGGLLIGIAIAWLNRHPGLPPELRLLLITGFLGGLTTFSTFSAEVVGLLGRGEYLWGTAAALAHLVGSLALTAVGVGLFHLATVRS